MPRSVLSKLSTHQAIRGGYFQFLQST
jgi:hypothetical protein